MSDGDPVYSIIGKTAKSNDGLARALCANFSKTLAIPPFDSPILAQISRILTHGQYQFCFEPQRFFR